MPIDLNYHHLYYFWVCARAGRVTTAAKELNLSQSALSLQLKSLERSLGRSLFNRTRTGLELTNAGRVVFDHCGKIFAHGAALSAALRVGGAVRPTEIRLGISSAVGRETALEFIDRFASVENSTATVYVGPHADILERLLHRRLDIAVTGEDVSRALGSGFRGRRVGTLTLNFYAAPDLAETLPGFPRAGQKVPMLFRAQDHGPRLAVERLLREKGIEPVTVAECEDVDLLQTLARRGKGVVALHRAATQPDLASGALVRIGAAQTGLQHGIWVMTPVKEPVDPVLRAAIAAANKS